MPDTLPIYSDDDRAFPYLSYRAKASLRVDAGSVSLPLAYKAVPTGATERPTSRILQLKQPGSIIVVEWAGVRIGTKPQPVIVTAGNSFVLAAAGADVDSVGLGPDGRETVAASGYLVLYTTERPENITMPALLTPWDGRYGNGTINAAYTYTPTELGFGQFLPGQTTPTSLKAIINNPPAQQTNAQLFL